MEYPIVYATNEKYIPYLGVSIQSIIENVDSSNDIHIFIFYNQLSENSISRIKGMGKKNIKIDFINVLDYLNCDLDLLKTSFHYSKEIYNRFLIPNILDNYKKVLYVDCDLIFNINPTKYFEIDIQDNYIGAVNDIGVCDKSLEYYEYVKSLDINPEKYFNSGMLIMNNEILIKNNFFENFKTIIKQDKKYLFPDQDILNIICKNKVFYLDYKYNFQWAAYLNKHSSEVYVNKKAYTQYMNFVNNLNLYLIHYTGGRKPWFLPDLHLSAFFWKYARLSPFYEDIIADNIINKVIDLLKKYTKFDLYKYKLVSLIPSKKQKFYKEKYNNIKSHLKKISKI